MQQINEVEGNEGLEDNFRDTISRDEWFEIEAETREFSFPGYLMDEKRRNFLLKFSKTGNRVVLLQTDTADKNKPLRLMNSKTPSYLHTISILEIEKADIDLGEAKQSLNDSKLLRNYYSSKMVRWIDFSDQSEQRISLVFDDELLCFEIRENKFAVLCQIELLSGLNKTLFQGFYKEIYVFSRVVAISKEKDQLVDFEYIDKILISELIDGRESEEDGRERSENDRKSTASKTEALNTKLIDLEE